MKQKKQRWWPWVFGLLLTAYGVLTLLDAFVIPRGELRMEPTPPPVTATPAPTAETPVSEETDAEPEPTEAPKGPEITEDSYVSDRISIHIHKLRYLETDVFAAEVELKDSACLRTALPGGLFGRNINATVRSMAEENGAILAINGDYYGFRDYGYVMRNGFLYRSEPFQDTDNDDLVIYEDGSAEIVRESEVTAEALMEAGARQIFSFGPALLREGEVVVREGQEVKWSMSSNPRTAFGVMGPLHYILLVSDGRTDNNAGLSLVELAELFQELGCTLAYNLDGGGSTLMWFMGEVVNYPTYNGAFFEREVSDIVYIGE